MNSRRLRLEDLDLLRAIVDVRRSTSEVNGQLQEVETKSGERRTVPIPRVLCRILTEHLGQYSSPDGWVFTSPAGQRLRRHNFYRRHFKPAVGRARLDPGLRFHDLRHSAASIAINRGANVLQVQQMLGHSSATVTLDTYGHILPALAEQLRQSLDEAFRDAHSATNVVEMWWEDMPQGVGGTIKAPSSTLTRAFLRRAGGTRTPDHRFWRPALCQLSYRPSVPHRANPV